ncbi:MAG TPA: hypothetical protein VFR37_16825 [Longimicrobium sp.]|nr:hypothetical protein [Longimicrobium sp.]
MIHGGPGDVRRGRWFICLLRHDGVPSAKHYIACNAILHQNVAHTRLFRIHLIVSQ